MNHNCLQGIRCPKCKQEEAFQIVCTALVDVTDGGTDNPRNVEWGASSHITCTCEHHGTVSEFTVENWPIDADHELMNGEKVCLKDTQTGAGCAASWWEVINITPAANGIYADTLITLRSTTGRELQAFPEDLARQAA